MSLHPIRLAVLAFVLLTVAGSPAVASAAPTWAPAATAVVLGRYQATVPLQERLRTDNGGNAPQSIPSEFLILRLLSPTMQRTPLNFSLVRIAAPTGTTVKMGGLLAVFKSL